MTVHVVMLVCGLAAVAIGVLAVGAALATPAASPYTEFSAEGGLLVLGFVSFTFGVVMIYRFFRRQ